MGKAMEWVELHARLNELEFEDARDKDLCCSAIRRTRTQKRCTLCYKAPHDMIVRRLACVSPVCHGHTGDGTERQEEDDDDDDEDEDVNPQVQCGIVWKVHQCSLTRDYQIFQNMRVHLRGHVSCGVIRPRKLTDSMKAFVAQQDESGIPPRAMIVNMMRNPNIPAPKHGWPTPQQIENALKTIRKLYGSKNSVRAVRAMVAEHDYTPDLKLTDPFLFGYTTNDDGAPYIGSGDDDDPFIVGVTSLALLDNCINYATPGRFPMFHADATFKLSDLGYPVITCGFTDRSRSYQLAAIFVVSRRTAEEYAHCFKSLARLFKTLRGVTIDVDAVISDAEEAQTNSYQQVYEFKRARVLMCFFHVLYNVRKKTRHLHVRWRRLIMKGLLDMHFSTSEEDYESTRDETMALWRSRTKLKSFAAYFEKQWLRGTFKNWQAFHSPTGYATTNNPCEIYNAVVKRFFQRRRWHMQMLLRKLMDIVVTTHPTAPMSSDYVVVPTPDVKTAAKLLMDSQRVVVTNGGAPGSLFVRHVQPAEDPEETEPHDSDSETDEYDQEFIEAFDCVAGGDECEEDVEPASPLDEHALAKPLACVDEVQAERDKERAAKLYDGAVKWSLKRSHERGMPSSGWLVDTIKSTCQCKYFVKFTVCCHVLDARAARGLGQLVDQKLRDRVQGRTVRARSKALLANKASKHTNASKTKKKSKKRSPKTTISVRKPSASNASARATSAIDVRAGVSLHVDEYPVDESIHVESAQQHTNGIWSVSRVDEEPMFEEYLASEFLVAEEMLAPVGRGRPPSASSALTIDYILDN